MRRGELHVVPTDMTPITGRWYVTTLRPSVAPKAAAYLRNFLSTPDAMQLMCSPGRCAAVAVPAAGLRDDLELTRTASTVLRGRHEPRGSADITRSMVEAICSDGRQSTASQTDGRHLMKDGTFR